MERKPQQFKEMEPRLKPTALVVQKDRWSLKLVTNSLNENGIATVVCNSENEAIKLITGLRHPDIIIMEPDFFDNMSIVDVHQIRKTPIVVISDIRGTKARVRALEAGADHYLTKPFDPDELVAMVNASLRARGEDRNWQEPVRYKNLEVDLDKKTLKRSDEIVHLTRREWQLLEYLAKNADKVVTNDQILAHVWHSEYLGNTAYLRVWISRLRESSGEHAFEFIKTRSGIGYILNTDNEKEKDLDHSTSSSE